MILTTDLTLFLRWVFDFYGSKYIIQSPLFINPSLQLQTCVLYFVFIFIDIPSLTLLLQCINQQPCKSIPLSTRDSLVHITLPKYISNLSEKAIIAPFWGNSGLLPHLGTLLYYLYWYPLGFIWKLTNTNSIQF